MLAAQARHVAFVVLALAALSAHASFGGSPCRADFGCHFVAWGLLVGVAAGIPLTALAFIGLRVFFCHPDRSKVVQAIVGGLSGAIAYELAAVGGALAGSLGKDPMLGLAPVWVILAISSALHARSSPDDAA